MPLWEVPVKVWVEAADRSDATTMALGDKPGNPARALLAEAGEPVLIDPDRAAARMEFLTELNLAAAQLADRQSVKDPRHPGLRFSPAAAATLRRLRGEGS